MDISAEVFSLCKRARAASRSLGHCPTARKNEALEAIARGVGDARGEILAANQADVTAAEKAGTPAALVDRLRLDAGRIAAAAEAVRAIAALEDPVGTVIERRSRPNGLEVVRVRAPLGVVAMVYESRPNVTVEASALCLKAGSAVVLRGGTDAACSNLALGRVIGGALESSGLSRDAVCLVPSKGRDAIKALVACQDVDLAIPRGGEALIRFVTEHARVPVVQHYKGVCHLYLDRGADLAMATELAENGKMSRPGVCNALECLLVDASEASRLIPPIAARLFAGGCELRGDPRSRELVPAMKAASEEDYGREFLDRILAVRVVDGLEGALAHVARYGSGHTEAICTPDDAHARRFQREVDAACVVVNASTRFHDGGELGLGAELGIATSKLHWRGPMGLEALTTMKWLVEGHGQVR